jgi:hypothetical protein
MAQVSKKGQQGCHIKSAFLHILGLRIPDYNVSTLSFTLLAVSGTQTQYFSGYITANKELGLPPLWLDEGIANCWSTTVD